jgi:cell division protein FtsB
MFAIDLRRMDDGVNNTRTPEILLTLNSSSVSTPSLENEMRNVPRSPSDTLLPIRLHSDNESLEKLAREQYQMVKPDEELFIINE